jgi:hypothetical protein
VPNKQKRINPEGDKFHLQHFCPEQLSHMIPAVNSFPLKVPSMEVREQIAHQPKHILALYTNAPTLTNWKNL